MLYVIFFLSFSFFLFFPLQQFNSEQKTFRTDEHALDVVVNVGDDCGFSFLFIYLCNFSRETDPRAEGAFAGLTIVCSRLLSEIGDIAVHVCAYRVRTNSSRLGVKNVINEFGFGDFARS